MKKQFQNRATFIAILFLIGSSFIIIQILRIQAMTDVFLPKIASGKWEQKTFYPERGKIFDRHGLMLAGNETVYEIGLNLPDVDNKETISSALSEVMGLDYQKTLTLINSQPAVQVYLKLADYVPSDQALKLQERKSELIKEYSKTGDASLSGLEFRAHLMRSYPDKTLASNVLGFVNQDNTGHYGVEQKYDNLLAGMPEIVDVPLDPNMAGELPKTPAGTDLILTIDRDIQSMVETELKNGIETTGSEAGTIIIMDPRTGGILGMASSPQMDLNNYSNFASIYPDASQFNRAVSMQYEPGSVFKILTMAAAIDSGLVSPQTTYLDTGFYTIGGVNIFNWDQGAWGVQDMVGCLQHSLNVCMARLADLMGEKTFYTYIQRFGIGHPTGIDISYEANGRLKNPNDEDWYKVDLGTNSFGQGVAVSPIQMMSAASAIANDGKMVYPHLVYAMVSNGNQKTTPVQTAGTPISAQTAHTVSDMLATAMQAGDSLANVDGYLLAGKTGTASIPGPNGLYDPNFTNASFIGWGPVDDPKFMVYIWLERPKKSEWASSMASPVFHDVVEKLVVLMDIPPDDIRKQLLAGQ
jgi:cell division protein FtsI/penicillin-binding protein 2